MVISQPWLNSAAWSMRRSAYFHQFVLEYSTKDTINLLGKVFQADSKEWNKLIQCHKAVQVNSAEIGSYCGPASQFSPKLTYSGKEKTYQSKRMVYHYLGMMVNWDIPTFTVHWTIMRTFSIDQVRKVDSSGPEIFHGQCIPFHVSWHLFRGNEPTYSSYIHTSILRKRMCY